MLPAICPGSNPALQPFSLLIGLSKEYEIQETVPDGVSPSGKAAGFDPAIPRFESWHPSHLLDGELEVEFVPGYMSRFESSTPATFASNKVSNGYVAQLVRASHS